MTAHTCTELTRGCYCCELNVDEMSSALESVTNDLEKAREKLFACADVDGARKIIDEIAELHTERYELIMGLGAARHKMGML